MNEAVRRTRAAWTRVFARAAQAPTAVPGTERDPDPARAERFDTHGIELLEDAQLGFDPYANAPLRSSPARKRPKTDLRALSAQILAERARKQAAG